MNLGLETFIKINLFVITQGSCNDTAFRIYFISNVLVSSLVLSFTI